MNPFSMPGRCDKPSVTTWLRAVLPPEFDPAAPGADAMDDQERRRRLIPRRFQPVLDDLRAKPRYVLSIGSRIGGAIRSMWCPMARIRWMNVWQASNRSNPGRWNR